MQIQKQDLPYYVVAVALFVFLKFAFRSMEADSFTFLTRPTTALVELMTGSKAVYIVNKGFYFDELKVIINKFCSAYNFMLISFLAFAYLMVQYARRHFLKVLMLLLAGLGAYLLTIGANAIRIHSAIRIQSLSLRYLPHYQSIIHEAVGIITNLTCLLLAYYLIERLLKHKTKQQ